MGRSLINLNCKYWPGSVRRVPGPSKSTRSGRADPSWSQLLSCGQTKHRPLTHGTNKRRENIAIEKGLKTKVPRQKYFLPLNVASDGQKRRQTAQSRHHCFRMHWSREDGTSRAGQRWVVNWIVRHCGWGFSHYGVGFLQEGRADVETDQLCHRMFHNGPNCPDSGVTLTDSQLDPVDLNQ